MALERPLIVAGSGRSGTTWILDVIASAGRLRTVFEPLNPAVSESARRYANCFIEPSANVPPLKYFMDTVISGQLHSLWTDYRSLPDRLIPDPCILSAPREAIVLCKRYLQLMKNISTAKKRGASGGIAVKFIRANLMLDWISCNYDVKIVFVVRHPGAVIESKQRLDGAVRKARLCQGATDWNPENLLRHYLNDEIIDRNFLKLYRESLSKRSFNPIEAQALIWCIENVPVLKSTQIKRYCLVYYEKLVENGIKEWARIRDYLGFHHKSIESYLNIPSQQSSEDFRAHGSTCTKSSRWMNRFNHSEKAAIQNILDIFDVGIYSMSDAMPRIP